MNQSAATNFRDQLSWNIATTIAKLRRLGTVAMSFDNLVQVTPTPTLMLGAPRGPSEYRELFRDIINSNPRFARFASWKELAR